MIFYGDRARDVDTAALLGQACDWLGRGRGTALPPVERHALLVAALVAVGEVAQGVLDALFRESGVDEPTPVGRALTRWAVRLGASVGRSWERGFDPEPDPRDRRGLDALSSRADLPPEVAIRTAEGFAHYAVYPESYWEAAKGIGRRVPARVVGIRSIGTTLSAVTAAALGAPPPLTVRPVGPPFERAIRPAPTWWAALGNEPGAVYAIADEGPGLSGSSFAAVADALDARGVAADSIVFLPSHGNPPGPMASARVRERWASTRKAVVTFDDLALAPLGARVGLERWVEDIVGPPVGLPTGLCGGRWRTHGPGPPRNAPADPQNERRKFIVSGRNGTVLMKFAGIGAVGIEKYQRQRRMAQAGLAVEPLGFRHGFIVERWRDDLARGAPEGPERDAFLRHLGGYLGFRARSFPAAAGDGASLAALLTMTRANVTEALGPSAGARCDEWRPRLPELERTVRRVATDGRLHGWEWLRTPDGGWLKTDAVDHCAGHDLVGCQDPAWDLAGAAVEFDLSSEESHTLARIAEVESGRGSTEDLVAFCRLAYAAFQLGAWTLAAERDGDRFGARTAAARYAATLRPMLA